MQEQLTHKDYLGKKTKLPVAVLLDNATNPINIGSAFRTCDALGASQLILTGDCPIPPNKKIKRASRSTESHVSWLHFEKNEEAYSYLTENSFAPILLEITDTSQDIRSTDFRSFDKVCLILGNENYGVSNFFLEKSILAIHIPMLGNNSSMNLNAALAIALYEVTGKII